MLFGFSLLVNSFILSDICAKFSGIFALVSKCTMIVISTNNATLIKIIRIIMSHSLHITIRIYLKINFEFATTCCGDSHRFSREKDGARDRVRKRCVFGCAKRRMSHFASPHFRIGTSMRCVSVLIRSNSTAFSSQNDFWPIASESKMKICRSSANEEKRTHSHLKYRAEKNIMCITLLIIIRVLNFAIDRCLDKFSIDFCVTGSRLSGKL